MGPAILPGDSGKGLGCRAGESCRNAHKAKSPHKGREKLLRGQGQHDSGTKNVAQPGEQVEEAWPGPLATPLRLWQDRWLSLAPREQEPSCFTSTDWSPSSSSSTIIRAIRVRGH